jgi:hypothetical protein
MRRVEKGVAAMNHLRDCEEPDDPGPEFRTYRKLVLYLLAAALFITAIIVLGALL